MGQQKRRPESYRVIIGNMMNLEVVHGLKLTGDKRYYDIAVAMLTRSKPLPA